MGLFDCTICWPKLCRCPQTTAWSAVGERKANDLLARGWEPIGAMLLDPKTGGRVTVDVFGRVQYWRISPSGALIGDENG